MPSHELFEISMTPEVQCNEVLSLLDGYLAKPWSTCHCPKGASLPGIARSIHCYLWKNN